MENISFTSLDELYKRVLPALNSKVEEIKRSGIKYIVVEDIWNYLRINVWQNKSNITLADMVDDILNIDNYEIDKYMKKIISKFKRHIIKDDDNLL